MTSAIPAYPEKTPEEMLREIHDRSRRTETRVTQIQAHLGMKIDGQVPKFDDGRIVLPSKHCTVQSVLDSIPEGWLGPVELIIGDQLVAVVIRPVG